MWPRITGYMTRYKPVKRKSSKKWYFIKWCGKFYRVPVGMKVLDACNQIYHDQIKYESVNDLPKLIYVGRAGLYTYVKYR